MDQSELVKKAQKGDDSAFSQLIHLYKEKLYKIAYAYLRSEENSLDAVSETIYKCYFNIKRLKEPRYFNTWIIKILINSCKDTLKSSNKVIYIDEYTKVDSDDMDALETELKIASNLDLYSAIDKLNDKFRTIIILKYFEDMTISQISEVLDIPEGTIKVYLRRAISVLRIELGEECI